MLSGTEMFLHLVRLGIGHTGLVHGLRFTVHGSVDWEALKALADAHGLSAVVLDGLNSLPLNSLDAYGMPQMLRLEWIGEVLQNYEARYKAYERAIGSLAGWYNGHGFKMMVLKGYACALDWPRPEHRPCGDIDIWLFGAQKEADALLESSEFRVLAEASEQVRAESLESVEKVQRIKVDNSHHHHTVFEWDGFTVENHYDFMNVHYGHRNKELEVIFKGLGSICHTDTTDTTENSDSGFKFQVSRILETYGTSDQGRAGELENSELLTSKGTKITNVEVYGEKVYLPSANFHALFLLRHSMQDFAAAVLTLRQVLDWAFFVEKHTKEIDWEWLRGVLAEYKMTDFFNCINAICVGDLGFSPDIFGTVQFDPFLKEKVLNDIIEPAFTRSTEGRGFFARIIFKYRRWQGNAWKQELCYHDSRWKAFWTGVWNHLLKPKDI